MTDSHGVLAWLITTAADAACLIGAVEAHKAKSDAAQAFMIAAFVTSTIGLFVIASGMKP